MPAPSLTVAIPTYLRDEVLVATIRQVWAQDPQPDELLIIDQSPRHDSYTESFLAEADTAGRLRWVRQPEPSLTKARNRALTEARGQVVLFIDDDVVLPPGFLRAHIAEYADLSVSAVTGPTPTPGDEPTLAPPVPVGNPIAAALTIPSSRLGRVTGIPRLHGGNHSVRRRTAIEAGGYDENFEASALLEDMDFAFRATHRGALLIFEPAVWLTHLRASSGGCRIPERAEWSESQKIVSALVFFIRHLANDSAPASARRTVLKMIVRAGPLRRENVVKLWRQPVAWFALIRAYREAHRRCASGVKSPFLPPNSTAAL